MSYKFLGFVLVLILITQVINIGYTSNSYNSAVDYKIVTSGENIELDNLKFSTVQNSAKSYLENKENIRVENEKRAKEEERKRQLELKAKEEAKKLEEAQKQKLQNELNSKVISEAKLTSKPNTIITGGKQEWMSAAGIPENDWQYVDFIVSRESGWNPAAVNKSSGACGLAQALPCAKTGCANFADPICALKWQYSYVKARYGGYAGAYAFWTSKHWY
jgi:hypothetical protein